SRRIAHRRRDRTDQPTARDLRVRIQKDGRLTRPERHYGPFRLPPSHPVFCSLTRSLGRHLLGGTCFHIVSCRSESSCARRRASGWKCRVVKCNASALSLRSSFNELSLSRRPFACYRLPHI